MKKLNLLLPYYWVRVRKGSLSEFVCLLTDAYFMKFIDFPPRRFLLLFSEKLLRHQAAAPSGGYLINPSQKAEEVIKMIQDTYRELKTYSFVDHTKRIMRSKLSLLLPPRRAAVGWDESEVRGALMIYDKIFGEAAASEGIVLQESKLIHINVGVVARKYAWMGEITNLKIKAPKPIPKIYEFLYRVDRGFREAMNEVLNQAYV